MRFWWMIFIPFAAQAFTLTSGNAGFRGWPGPEVTFNVNTANCPAGIDVPGLITDAVKVWNNVATSRVKVSYNGSTSSTTFASPTTVYCETNFQGVTGADANVVPAAANTQIVGSQTMTGILYLNASGGQANIGNFDRNLLEIIIAHEVGHILGLGHSQDSNALMYYNAGSKSSLTLAQDDIDGVSYLYPRNEFGSDKIMGCALVKEVSRRPPGAGFLVLFLGLFLLPLVTYWRLRRGCSYKF